MIAVFKLHVEDLVEALLNVIWETKKQSVLLPDR